MRNFKKLKTLDDYCTLDVPFRINLDIPLSAPVDTQAILRMLVRPKYGKWYIPDELRWLESTILLLSNIDKYITGIEESFCYVTVRHGIPFTTTDGEFHFDGSSFRTDIIPERNYIWVNHTPCEYKAGELSFPDDFNPCKHNLFTFASDALSDAPIQKTEAGKWYMLSPFCLHRRPPVDPDKSRTFIRVCFTDIEGRDINNTQNPLLKTDAYGRDPVKTFRNKLSNYKEII